MSSEGNQHAFVQSCGFNTITKWGMHSVMATCPITGHADVAVSKSNAENSRVPAVVAVSTRVNRSYASFSSPERNNRKQTSSSSSFQKKNKDGGDEKYEYDNHNQKDVKRMPSPSSSLVSSSSFSSYSSRKSTTTIEAVKSGLFSASSRSFGALGLDNTIASALHAENITQPTTIQTRGIPAILHGSDVILGAATGSGKTLAYLLPIVQQLKQAEAMWCEGDTPLRVRRRARAVILVPTRELAEQVMFVARSLSHKVKFRVGCAVGGSGSNEHKGRRERLDEIGGIDVLVATTGRLLQLCDARALDIRYVTHVVIDEVDTMFDKGFAPDVERILQMAGHALVQREKEIGLQSQQQAETVEHEQNKTAINGFNTNDQDGNNKQQKQQQKGTETTRKRATQLIAAGATHPAAAVAVYESFFYKPVRVHVDLHRAPVGLEQRFIRVASSERATELISLVRDDNASEQGGVMIFCNTVESCRFVAHYLDECDIPCTSAHGDMPPLLRDEQWMKFRDNIVPVVVCTDMAGRGLDHDNVRHVILFDFPTSAVDYVHRAGRTARAGRSGRVTSMVTKKDEQLARALEKAARARVDALASEQEAKQVVMERRRKERQAQRERERMMGTHSGDGQNHLDGGGSTATAATLDRHKMSGTYRYGGGGSGRGRGGRGGGGSRRGGRRGGGTGRRR